MSDTLICHPMDIALARVGDDVVLNIFALTGEREPIILQKSDFANYFYILLNEDTDVKEAIDTIQKIEQGKYSIIDIEKVDKTYIGKSHPTLKVSVNHVYATKPISELLKKETFVKEALHVDISYIRKFLFDTNFEFLKPIEVEANTIENTKAPNATTYALKSFTKIDGDELTFNDLTVIGFDIETYGKTKQINSQENPILSIAVYGKDKNHQKVFTWSNHKSKHKYVVQCEDEVAMIKAFFKFLKENNPHIICGYNSDAFDWAYIKDRCDKYKLKLNIGLDGSELKFSSGNVSYSYINGMPNIDLYHYIRTNMRNSLETTSYSLSNVSKELLGDDKDDVDISQLYKAWDTVNETALDEYMKYNLHDSKLCVDLLEKLFSNMAEFTRMIHLPLSDVTRLSYSQLVENYLIMNANKYDVLAPPKPPSAVVNKRLALPQNIGAFVFKPTPGFYEHIAVFDFRSLYPSIIASCNIDEGVMNLTNNPEHQVPEYPGQLYFDPSIPSFIPQVTKQIVLRRDELKAELKVVDESKKEMLKARIYNLKILANSLYGYLSYARARWHCYECGGATTAFARHYIKKTIAKAEEAGFKTIYSDTDSVFLELKERPITEALEFVTAFNKTLPGIMELEFEDEFETGIFVQAKGKAGGGAKKRYALYDEDKDYFKIVGLEYVRNDWSDIARETQYEVLKRVLKDRDPKSAFEYSRGVIKEIEEGKIPMEKFVLTSRLSRDLDKYETNLPHVIIARQMKERGEVIHSRSHIRYVIAKGKGAMYEKARIPEDISLETIDTAYYVENQVEPAVSQILAVFGYNGDDLSETHVQGGLGDFF